MGKEFGEVFRDLAETAGKSLEGAAERISRLGKEGADRIEKGVADAEATDARVQGRFEGLRHGAAAEDANAIGGAAEPRYENPGHHDPHGGPNAYIPKKAVLPADAEAQFANSIQTGGNVRWTKVGTGRRAVYYRYFQHEANVWHWSGSTDGVTNSGRPAKIPMNQVPIEIRRR
jgi:hypothetical protein